jgi:branched-chain amino acid transport system permease protein
MLDSSAKSSMHAVTDVSVMGPYRRDLLGLCGLVAIAIVLGLYLSNFFYLTVLVDAAISAIAALGMFLLFGFAGQISIGQSAFFGVGAYTSAYLVTQLGQAPIVGTLAAIALSGIFGWLVSRPMMRLTTNYLAMGTLAFGMICSVLFTQLHSVTGGLDPGIVGLAPFRIGSATFTSLRSMYWLVVSVLVIVMLLTINLVHSRVGRALRALKFSEVAAAGLGIDVVRYKVLTFTLAATMTGLAGSLFAHTQGTFNASSFDIRFSIDLLIMIVVGSVLTPWGALFGALFLSVAPNLLADFDQYRLLIYGVIMTAVMIYMPDGLGKEIVDVARRLLRRASST